MIGRDLHYDGCVWREHLDFGWTIIFVVLEISIFARNSIVVILPSRIDAVYYDCASMPIHLVLTFS